MAASTRRIAAYSLGFVLFQTIVALTIAGTPRMYAGLGAWKMGCDTRSYFEYASRTLAGEIPWRDFLVEYPLLALPVFLAPRMVADGLADYQRAFGGLMIACNALTVIAFAFWVGRRQGVGAVPGRLAWYTLFVVSLCPLFLLRYDAAPTAVAFAAACAWATGRNVSGGTLAGLGFLMKIYPGVLAAPGLVGELADWRRTRGRGLIAFGSTVLAGTALWWAIGAAGMGRSLQFHAERGLEVGSLYSGVSILAGRVLGSPVTQAYRHYSTEITSPWTLVLARAAVPIQALALVVVMVRCRRWRAEQPMRAALAAMTAFIAFGKVLSPQYMIWLFPFAAAAEGRVGRWSRPLVFACCVLTTLLYPWGSSRLAGMDFAAVAVLNLRNALLLGLWGWLVFGSDRVPASVGGESTLESSHSEHAGLRFDSEDHSSPHADQIVMSGRTK